MRLIRVSGVFDNESYLAKRYFTDEERDRHDKIDAEYKRYIDEYVKLHDKDIRNEHDFRWREKEAKLKKKIKEFDSILSELKRPVIERMNKEREKLNEEERIEKEKTKRVFDKCRNDTSFQIEVEKSADDWPRTSNPKLSGYLMQNGEMLDFSYEGRQRDRDHREIASIHGDLSSYTDGMRQFQLATGAIRMHHYGDGYSFDWMIDPNFTQIRKMSLLR